MRRLSVLICLVLLLKASLGLDQGIAAQPKSWLKPMQFTIVRSSEKGCEPNCPEWLMAEGEIMPESALEFRKALDLLGQRKLPIVLNSRGGNMVAALEIGYMLRRAGLSASVGATKYKGCDPFDAKCRLPAGQGGTYRGRVISIGGYCYSACPLILASGTRRLASPKTQVGVHQIRVLAVEKNGSTQGSAGKRQEPKWISGTPELKNLIARILSNYLTDMGVSLDLLDDMERASGDSVFRLSSKRRLQLKLATEAGGVELLTARGAAGAK